MSNVNTRAANAAFKAAMTAANTITTAADKLATSAAKLAEACGGHAEAQKWLNDKRGEGRTWKTEREENTPLWKVYNAISVAKSRAKPKAKRKARQATGKAEQAEQAAAGKAEQAEQAAAGKAATPADILGIVLTWSPEQIAQAIRDQTTTLESTAVDTITAVLGILINQPTPTPTPKAPRKRAPRKTTK